MAEKRKRKRGKRTWGKPPLRPPSLVAGEVRGELLVIEYTGKSDEQGHRLVLVEDVQTGERKEVRAANLLNGNTASLGRIKKARYIEYMTKQISNSQYTELDELDPATLAEARADRSGVGFNGETIKKAPRKPAPVKTVTPSPVVDMTLPLPPFSEKLTSDEFVRFGILDVKGHWTPRGREWKASRKPDFK